MLVPTFGAASKHRTTGFRLRTESESLRCRPVAFSAGATDEVSHSMGQQRVQLGMHVVATALPADDESTAQPEDVVLYFGIIDILQVRC